MQKEKENAQLSEMIERAQKKGINLIPIIEFFTSWYTPDEAGKVLDDIQQSYTISFLSLKEGEIENEFLKGHMIFLQLVKRIMIDAKVNNLIMK